MGDAQRKLSVLQGRVLGGKYRLLELLGQGGMGAVWKADHLTLMSPVAVKIIEPFALGDSEASHARFLREARAAASLRSPHVVQVLDHGVDDGAHFIVMELLEGETLRQKLKREKQLSPKDTYKILTHIGRALMKAHEAGIVHRDLKPENIFLVRNHDEEIAKVLDFGVAKRTSTQAETMDGQVTNSGVMLGTPSYMSPEQAWGTREVDTRSDLWAMGVMAFECLCGRRVFDGGAVGALIVQICTAPLPVPSEIARVPDGFDAWFARALAREASGRFQSAQELIDSLRPILAADADRPVALVPKPDVTPPHSTGPLASGADGRQAIAAVTVTMGTSRASTRKRWVAAGVLTAVLSGGAALALGMTGAFGTKPVERGASASAPSPAETVVREEPAAKATEAATAPVTPPPASTDPPTPTIASTAGTSTAPGAQTPRNVAKSIGAATRPLPTPVAPTTKATDPPTHPPATEPKKPRVDLGI